MVSTSSLNLGQDTFFMEFNIFPLLMWVSSWVPSRTQTTYCQVKWLLHKSPLVCEGMYVRPCSGLHECDLEERMYFCQEAPLYPHAPTFLLQHAALSIVASMMVGTVQCSLAWLGAIKNEKHHKSHKSNLLSCITQLWARSHNRTLHCTLLEVRDWCTYSS